MGGGRRVGRMCWMAMMESRAKMYAGAMNETDSWSSNVVQEGHGEVGTRHVSTLSHDLNQLQTPRNPAAISTKPTHAATQCSLPSIQRHGDDDI